MMLSEPGLGGAHSLFHNPAQSTAWVVMRNIPLVPSIDSEDLVHVLNRMHPSLRPALPSRTTIGQAGVRGRDHQDPRAPGRQGAQVHGHHHCGLRHLGLAWRHWRGLHHAQRAQDRARHHRHDEDRRVHPVRTSFLRLRLRPRHSRVKAAHFPAKSCPIGPASIA